MKADDHILAATTALGGGATAFALACLLRLGIGQDQVFALVGALVGASATVAGAAWLADRNRRLERDAEAELMVAEYGRVQSAANAAQEVEPVGGGVWPPDYRPRIHHLADVAGGVHAVAAEALVHARALSFVQRASVRRVQYAIDEFLSFYTNANAEGDLDPMDERSYPAATADIVDEVQAAIAALTGRGPRIEKAQGVKTTGPTAP